MGVNAEVVACGGKQASLLACFCRWSQVINLRAADNELARPHILKMSLICIWRITGPTNYAFRIFL